MKRHMEGFVIGDSRVHKTIADVRCSMRMEQKSYM